jgi:hypothetical protein
MAYNKHFRPRSAERRVKTSPKLSPLRLGAEITNTSLERQKLLEHIEQAREVPFPRDVEPDSFVYEVFHHYLDTRAAMDVRTARSLGYRTIYGACISTTIEELFPEGAPITDQQGQDLERGIKLARSALSIFGEDTLGS